MAYPSEKEVRDYLSWRQVDSEHLELRSKSGAVRRLDATQLR